MSICRTDSADPHTSNHKNEIDTTAEKTPEAKIGEMRFQWTTWTAAQRPTTMKLHAIREKGTKNKSTENELTECAWKNY